MSVGFAPLDKVWTMFQYASILMNQRLHFDTFLPTSSRVCKFSLDYKGIQPGMAAQPMRTRKTSKQTK